MPKKRYPPHQIRLVLADNVKARMAYVYSEEGDRPLALAKDAKTSLSTIQRLLAAAVATEVDTLGRVADALDISVYQLFIPNLHPRNPQMLKGVSKDEQRLYDLLEAANHRRKAKS